MSLSWPGCSWSCDCSRSREAIVSIVIAIVDVVVIGSRKLPQHPSSSTPLLCCAAVRALSTRRIYLRTCSSGSPAVILNKGTAECNALELIPLATCTRSTSTGYQSYLSSHRFFFSSTSCARFSSNGDDDGGQTKFFSLKSPISFRRDITSVHLRWLYEFRRSIGDVGDPTARRAGRPTSEAI